MPKVLVADDSIAVRKVAERLLTEAGLGVTLAANGEEALASLAKECPDLIVSDVIMPDKSGYEVCTFVRSQAAFATTPVLLISGIVNDEVTKQAESCLADGVLKKPFQGTSLKDRVLELLAKRQNQQVPSSKPKEEKAPAPSMTRTVPKMSDEQLVANRLAVAKLSQIEGDLQSERLRTAQLSRRVAELEGQGGRLKELESALASEREQSAHLKKTVADAGSLANRVQELEAAVTAERERSAQAAKKLAEAAGLSSQVQELEVALKKERETGAQYAIRMSELQKNAARAQEFEAALNAERQAATQLVQQMTALEKTAGRVQEMTQQLAKEQQQTAELTRRLNESERAAGRAAVLEQEAGEAKRQVADLMARLSEAERIQAKVQESEALLQTERDRNAVLARRVAEAEQATIQANKRFEEMAKKLGEIAGLASQLGNGARRS
jgi:DNA-binding response OmpR family regulator